VCISVYNCVYYCDTCYIGAVSGLSIDPLLGRCHMTYDICIGVVSVYMQYNCVYYSDT
jgi:hypothetical protein